jgi:hypothetical protein
LDDRLHRELWTSWASLLRSYATAHGLNSTAHAVVEVGPDTIVLRVNSRWLRFTHTTMSSGEGLAEPFSLLEDGTVRLDGNTQEMDMAAEQIARQMMS